MHKACAIPTDAWIAKKRRQWKIITAGGLEARAERDDWSIQLRPSYPIPLYIYIYSLIYDCRKKSQMHQWKVDEKRYVYISPTIIICRESTSRSGKRTPFKVVRSVYVFFDCPRYWLVICRRSLRSDIILWFSFVTLYTELYQLCLPCNDYHGAVGFSIFKLLLLL